MIELMHGKIRLALHELRRGHGRTLLLLHGLGERSPLDVPAELASWPGPVAALDFTGHGQSDVPRSGGYTAEILMADADAALQHAGEACLVGRGLGAYVALLLAGGRPKQVRGAILRDGPGLAAGGIGAVPGYVSRPQLGKQRIPDPFALAELTRDVRPPDYAAIYLHQATHLSELDPALYIVAKERPEWLAAVAQESGTRVCDLEAALESCAAIQLRRVR